MSETVITTVAALFVNEKSKQSGRERHKIDFRGNCFSPSLSTFTVS